MRFLVTLGPTYESLDSVRRLTNFSTGTLGTQLVNFLSAKGHQVTALRGHYTTCTQTLQAEDTREFTTTEHLLSMLRELAKEKWSAVFHVAAVSDFRFGQTFERRADGSLTVLNSAKFSTRTGVLLAELVPTPKIISDLRTLFSEACLFGWKYEVEGGQGAALAAGARQLQENRTDYCVVNGPAYGAGFGVLSTGGAMTHAADSDALCRMLLRLVSGV